MEGGSYLTKISFKFLYGAQVRVFQENGEYMKKSSIQTLSINKQRIKLSKGHTTRAKEEYSSAMQVLFLNLTQWNEVKMKLILKSRNPKGLWDSDYIKMVSKKAISQSNEYNSYSKI